MEIDSSVIKLQENNGQESGSDEKDFIPTKSTSKLIQNCIQCIGVLVLHVENAMTVTKSSLMFADKSLKVKSCDGSDIDIVEHSVKTDPDDPSRYLKSIKKCVLQLCCLCLDQNIYVNCDLSFNKIEFYECLEDSTRSLVINYLTENISYLIEHIGFIISMFKQEKGREEAKHIRKSLQKIYKQILLIPLNSNLDEAPKDFQNLNNSQWYNESMQHLGRKLSLLRTALIQFKKILKNRIVNSNNAAINENTAKRKTGDITVQPSAKRMKHENNELDVTTLESDSERSPKKKSKDTETSIKEIVGVVRIENDSESDKKKKKTKVKSEMSEKTIDVSVQPSSNHENNVLYSPDNMFRVPNIPPVQKPDVIIVESDTEKKKKNKAEPKINSVAVRAEHNGHDSESSEGSFIPSNSTSKLIKSCMKCMAALIEHVENALSNSNDFDSSLNIKSSYDSEISIVEPSVKYNLDNASRYLRSIKKCVLQLCLEQNININSDLSFNKIDFYVYLDDSTKSLVIHYLTENIGYLIKNVDIIISMFKQENDVTDSKDIRKILQKIHKQILLVPLNHNPDGTSKDFQNLDSSQRYSEAMHHLGEKLSVLRTSLIKLKKILRKSSLDSNNSTTVENIDLSQADDQPSPAIPPVQKPDIITVESDTERKKKTTQAESKISDNNESDTKSVKKIIKPETNASSDITESFVEDESDLKRKDKHLKETNKRKINRSKIESDTSDTSIDEELSRISPKNNSKKSKVTKKRKRGAKSKNTKQTSEDDDIFSALAKGELEVEYEDESENVLKKIVKENNLNDNEKFLYLQDLLLQAKEKNELSDEMTTKLKELTVLVDWEVPPIHRIWTGLTVGPKPDEQIELTRLGVSNKRFHRDEDVKIRENWLEFCKVHDLDGDPRPFLQLRHAKQVNVKKEERVRFVQFLAKGLNNRTLYSIYRRFKRIFSDIKHGRFNDEEDELIMTYCSRINSDRNKFATLSHILNRSRWAIQYRHTLLTRQNNERTKWTLKLETYLIECLLKTIGSKNLQDLQHAKLNIHHYSQVANQLNIPSEKVRNQWLKFIYSKLFSKERLDAGRIRLKLFQILIDSGITDFAKVDWNEIASHFEGCSKEFLRLQFMIAQVKISRKSDYKDLNKTICCFKKYIAREQVKGNKPFARARLIMRYRMTEKGLEEYK